MTPDHTASQRFTPDDQRAIFGLQPTGTVAITGMDATGQPTGFVVGTFQSLSLEPPLVTFCIANTSSTWPILRSQGRFTANLLGTTQLDACKALGRKGRDKFNGLTWEPGPIGTPRLTGSVAWIDCHILSEVIAGDHFVIVGSVAAIEKGSGHALIFCGRRFGEATLWDDPPAATATPPMLTRIASAWEQAWGQGNTRAFEDLVAPGYVRHSKTGDQMQLADILRQIEESHAAFSDFKVDILRGIEKDDMVALHWRSRGRHTGMFMNVPPTQRDVSVQGAAFLKHKDGRILEEWVVWDPRELLASMQIWHLGNQPPFQPSQEK